MSIPGGIGGGPLSGGGGRGITRGRIGNNLGGLAYPSPFFDVAHTYLPQTVKALFRWCRYYFMTNPLINATVMKLSEYPITDFVIEHEDPRTVKKWTEYLHDQLRVRSFQVETGIDYHAYGNSICSLSFPFIKHLTCSGCGARERANLLRNFWKFTNYAFRLTCPKCGVTADAIANDLYLKNASDIRPMRWNPEDFEISYNEITGDYSYFYNIPSGTKADITIGRKEIVEAMPQLFIQAMKEQKSVLFNKSAIFHLKRPTLATNDRGWGFPILLPVLKDTFYLQIMKKAQEAILLEHIVPLRMFFPQPGSGAADPYTSVNLGEWRDSVAAELARWRMDQNYMPIMPLPLGNQTVGGDGRALLLSGEIQSWSEHIMVGLGVPREFLLGGMSYAGTNVSMRMLENQFLRYMERQHDLLKFMIQEVAGFMQWPLVDVRFKPFKMADDIQRKAFLFQLNQAQKISDKTLLADSDLEVDEENAAIVREVEGRSEATKKAQLAMASIQGEVSLVMAKFQARAQMMSTAGQPQPQGAPAPSGDAAADPMAGMTSPLSMANDMAQGGGGADLRSMAMVQARMLVAMPPDQQQMALVNLRSSSPELADLVQEFMAQIQKPMDLAAGPAPANADQAAATQVDMRPLPEQRGPRRAASSV